MQKSISERAKELTSKLTLREKIGQITQHIPGWECYEKIDGEIVLTEKFKEHIKEYGGLGFTGLIRSGHWVNKFYGNGIELEDRVNAANLIQKYIMENTRVPIPALFNVEAAHGVFALGGTVFPENICNACSFNPDLYEEMMSAVGKEIKLSGSHIAFITMLDVAKDPRWGRTEECYGEDPYMSAIFAERAVKAMKKEGVLSCGKHYFGCGASEGGIHGADISMGEREMRDIHLPLTKAAVNAGMDIVMVAYSSIDGVPLHANKYMLKDILCDELGYDGIIMSDGAGVENMRDKLGLSVKESAVAAVKCGIELSLFDQGNFRCLEEAVSEGFINEELIDRACEKMLSKKIEIGLLDNPYIDDDKVTDYVNSGYLQKLSYDVAAESIVMLKNDGVLPLDSKKKVVVIGQNAVNEYCLLGSYTAQRKEGEGADLLTALKSRFENLTYCEGWNYERNKCDFNSAIEECKNADVIIFAAGGNSCASFENENAEFDAAGGSIVNDEFIDCGEGKDSSTLNLPKTQTDLLIKLKELGKPIVTVLIQGRPYAINEVVENSNAIINAWYPGQEGGFAIADILIGKVNPSGKLTVSIPKNVGCIPVNYNRVTTFEYNYVETDEKVIYPFGYGLSYSKFVYDNLNTEKLADNEFKVNVDVTNESDITGKETVMLFIHGRSGSVCR